MAFRLQSRCATSVKPSRVDVFSPHQHNGIVVQISSPLSVKATLINERAIAKPRKLKTYFSFSADVLWRLKNTKANEGITMDCCFAMDTDLVLHTTYTNLATHTTDTDLATRTSDDRTTSSAISANTGASSLSPMRTSFLASMHTH